MDVRWRKLWSDVVQRKARAALTLLGLVIGFWGLATVLVAERVLKTDLAWNYAKTRPADLVISAAGLDSEALALLARLPEIETIERRRLIGARLRIGEDRMLPIVLHVVDDFRTMTVARVFAEFGAFPPQRGQLVLERDSRPLIRFFGGSLDSSGPGGVDSSTLSMVLPGGREVEVPMVGTVHDPGQAPARMEMMAYAYVDRETAQAWWPEMPGTVPEERLLLRMATPPENTAALDSFAKQCVAAITAAGGTVNSFSTQLRDEHPHQFQMNTILTLLLGLGLLGFALSAVLVVNLIATALGNQLRQIGALKTMGATTTQVTLIFLTGLCILGLGAVAIAYPLAIRSGLGMADGIAMMLNFELHTTTLPMVFHLSLLAAGALFPVAAGFFPVRRWCRVSVRAALDNHGFPQGALAVPPETVAASRFPLTIVLGMRNLRRNRQRTVLGGATLMIGALVFLCAMNLRASLIHTAEVEDARWHHEVAVRLGQPVSLADLRDVEALEWVQGVELWQTAGARLAAAPLAGGRDIGILGVPASTTVFSPQLLDGSWPAHGDAGSVVASHRLLQRYPALQPGDLLSARIAGRDVELRLSGVVKLFGPGLFYMDGAGLQTLTGDTSGSGRLAFVLARPETKLGIGEMSIALEQTLARSGLPVTDLQPSQMASRIISNHLLAIEIMLGIVAFMMLAVSALGLASGLATNVVERSREFGVLRAMGATRTTIQRIIAVETTFVAAAAWLLALLLALPASPLLTQWFGAGVVGYPFDHAISTGGVVLCLATVICLGLAAGWLTASATLGAPLREAIDYE